MGVQGWESPIFVNFAPPEAQNRTNRFGLYFLLCVYLDFVFCVFFYVSFGHFVLVSLAYVVLGLVFLILSQEIGWEKHLGNDPFLCLMGRKP